MPTPVGTHPAYVTMPDGTVYEVGARVEAHGLGLHTDVDLVTVPAQPGDGIVLGTGGKWVPARVVTETALWQYDILYPAGAEVLWTQADPHTWQANRENVGEEPGVSYNSATAWGFPGPGVTVAGLQATLPTGSFTDGFDAFVSTDGTLGTVGRIISLGGGDAYLQRTVTGWSAGVRQVGGGFVTCDAPVADTTHPYWWLSAGNGVLKVESSADGATYGELGSVPLTGAVSVIDSANIGCDRIEPGQNYDGVVAGVTITKAGVGATVASWLPMSQGADGQGPSPLTGEVWIKTPGTVLTPVGTPTPVPQAWSDLGTASDVEVFVSDVQPQVDVDLVWGDLSQIDAPPSNVVEGPAGPPGPPGPTGISTVIIGSFGTGTGTPTTLPPDGALPAGWAASGSPVYQMEVGQSLVYESPTGAGDPLNGGMYQYVGITVIPEGWILLGEIVGPEGPRGDPGTDGAPAPTDVYVPMAQIYYKSLTGPWDGTSAGATMTFTGMAAGTYLVLFGVSAVATTAGMRWVDLRESGQNIHAVGLYFNTTSEHHSMGPYITTRTFTAGDHALTVHSTSEVVGDSNDRGFVLLIPVGV